MGQKVNPISTRVWLYPTRKESSWFSKFHYTSLFVESIVFQNYLKSVLLLNNIDVGRIHMELYPNRYKFLVAYRSQDFLNTQKNYKTRELTSYVKFLYQILMNSTSQKNVLPQEGKILPLKTDFLRNTSKIFAEYSHKILPQTDIILPETKLHTNIKISSMVKKHFSMLLCSSNLLSNTTRTKYSTLYNSKSKNYNIQNQWQVSLLNNMNTYNQLLQFYVNIIQQHLLINSADLLNLNHPMLSCTKLWLQKNLTLTLYDQTFSFFLFEQVVKTTHVSATMNINSNVKQNNYSVQKLLEFQKYFISMHCSSIQSFANPFVNLKDFCTSSRVFGNLCNGFFSFYWLNLRLPFSSANFIAGMIVHSLENRESFRKISKQIIQAAQQNPMLLGIRLMCSGRIQGAEMARVELRKYGQTSNHDLTSRIDYANRFAVTTYGLFGVQVWLCYRSNTQLLT